MQNLLKKFFFFLLTFCINLTQMSMTDFVGFSDCVERLEKEVRKDKRKKLRRRKDESKVNKMR